MKKTLLSVLGVLVVNVLTAQPCVPSGSSNPIKFQDVVSRFGNQHAGAIINKNHTGTMQLFDQWAWYWQQHLDADGYIVSPAKTITAWQDYMGKPLGARMAARTTSVLPADWIFQGPHSAAGGDTGLGRVNVVTFDPIDSNTVYVGSAAGGTWKTTNGGITWSSLYDFLPTLGVSDIKINPLNHNTIYVATGDDDAGDTYSAGVVMSHDGGTTWLTTSLSWLPTNNNFIRSLLINPVDTNSMILATNIGIYTSHDAGATWASAASGNFRQILFKPGDTSTLYGTIYTDTSAQIVLSTNGGSSWNAVTSFEQAQRISLAVCPASPAVVMAVACNTSTSGLMGIYTSTNSGATYTATYTNDTVACSQELLGYDLGLPTYDCGGEGNYALCIAMNPSNASEVTVGAINTYYSADGGASWTMANEWYNGVPGTPVVHANKHCLAYSPLTGALFETSDGGLYKNYGPLTAPWINLSNGICVTEFVRNAIDNNVSFCIGGSRNNGTKTVSSTATSELTGGNGTQPLINYGNPSNIFYCSSQYGYILMTRDGGHTFHSITDTLNPASGGFITPFVLHPTDTQTLYLGFKNVYVTHNNGFYWTAISPVFDAGSYINELAIAMSNPNYIYAALNESNGSRSVIYYTSNAGTTWDSVHVPFTNFISGLAIDPKNEKHISVTVSGYSATDKVYSYNATTNSWTNETGSLPNLPADCIIYDTITGTRYIGTDAAVFYKDTAAPDWTLFNTNLPSVHVYDLKINYATLEVWAATFGRGIWKSQRADNPGTLSVNQLKEVSTVVSPNPSHGSFTISTSESALLDGAVQVKLFSADGKMVFNTHASFDPGGSIKVNTNGLAAGFYICEISNKALSTHVQVVVY